MQDIDIDLKPSRYFIAFISIISCISFYAIICTPVAVWLQIAFCIVTGSYVFFILWHDVLLRSANSIIGLRLLPDGNWLLFTPEKVLTGELLGESTVTRYLAVLRFISLHSRRKYSCIIFQDVLDPVIYKNLLVTLRGC